MVAFWLLGGCAKPPAPEIDAAKKAVESARAAVSAEYFPAEDKAVSDKLYADMEEVKSMLRRYYEKASLVRWRRWAREAIHWSREYAAPAIVVRKAEKTLTLYLSGWPIRVYRIALGFNGLNDKRLSGDGATPEGKYQIVLKKDEGETKYHKALLINYPNEEDIKRFKSARPRRVAFSLSRIGGLIEIHGGKKSGLEQTSGCIALNDKEMDDLFGRVVVGTPVTIVGTTEGLTNQVLEGQENEWGAAQGKPERAF